MAAKFRILLLLLFAGFIAQAQVHLERSPASVLPTDQNLKVGHVLIIPTLTDTTAALSYGIDSLGMVIQIKSTGTWYKRDTFRQLHVSFIPTPKSDIKAEGECLQ